MAFAWSNRHVKTYNRHHFSLSFTVASRPKKLLVFVNPVSGGSKGRQIYFKFGEPFFKLCNIETEVIGRTLVNFGLSQWTLYLLFVVRWVVLKVIPTYQLRRNEFATSIRRSDDFAVRLCESASNCPRSGSRTMIALAIPHGREMSLQMFLINKNASLYILFTYNMVNVLQNHHNIHP